MSFWRLLGYMAVAPVLLVGLGTVALMGARYYSAEVFPQREPTRALSSLFVNPDQATVIESEQHGAFKYGDVMYTAQGIVRGEALRLQPYMQSVGANDKGIRDMLGGESRCSVLLSNENEPPDLYAVSSDRSAPDNLDSYVAYQPSTHTFCFTHLEL